MITKRRPAAVSPADGSRNSVGSSRLNDPKHNDGRVDRQQSVSGRPTMNKQVKPGELPLPTSAERITTPPAADAIKKEVVAKANAMLAEDFDWDDVSYSFI
jgi:hypothetical protein